MFDSQAYSFRFITLEEYCYVSTLYVKNMCSLIANKIKINLCLVLNKILYCSHNSMCHLSRFDLNNNNLLQLLLFFTLFRVHNNNCSIEIFTTVTFKPQLLSSYATCLHTSLTEFLQNCRCLLCLAFYIAG